MRASFQRGLPRLVGHPDVYRGTIRDWRPTRGHIKEPVVWACRHIHATRARAIACAQRHLEEVT